MVRIDPRLRQALVIVASFAIIVAVELLVLAYVRNSSSEPSTRLARTILMGVATLLIPAVYLLVRRLTRIAALPAVLLVMAVYAVSVVVLASRLPA